MQNIKEKKYKIGIIAALKKEINNLYKNVKNYKIHELSNIKFYSGNIHHIKIIIAQSGIGKVFSGITCAILLQKYKVNLIINIGSAGSLNDKLKPGSIVIPNNISYHDVDLTAFGYNLGQIKNCPKLFSSSKFMLELTEKFLLKNKIQYKKELIISGDSFIHTQRQKTSLKKKFPEAIAVDMESAAIAHVCYQFKIPILIIKSISDFSNNYAANNFKKFINLAARKSSIITINIVYELLNKPTKFLLDYIKHD